MAEQTVSVPEHQEAPTQETRESGRYLVPPVDIYEAPEGLVVVADLPGVDREHIDVRVDNNVLTIRGRAEHRTQGEQVYEEFQLLDYYRQFQLGEKVDQGKITAEMKHGVLTLRLPKVEEPKPRKISIAVG